MPDRDKRQRSAMYTLTPSENRYRLMREKRDEQVLDGVRKTAKKAGVEETTEALWAFFVDR